MSFDARIDVTPEVAQEETPKQLTVSQILNDLNNGTDRQEIRKKYNLSQAEIKFIFTHPKLQGVRVKKQKVMRIELIDDTETMTVNPNQMSITDVNIADMKPLHIEGTHMIAGPAVALDEPMFVHKSSIQLSETATFSHQTEINDNQNEIQD
tara:strand:- start:211 stop:666 length:456 start_codon:yes stop_codon:yes gene_type:complete